MTHEPHLLAETSVIVFPLRTPLVLTATATLDRQVELLAVGQVAGDAFTPSAPTELLPQQYTFASAAVVVYATAHVWEYAGEVLLVV